MSYVTIVTNDAANQTLSITVVEDHWIIRDKDGHEIGNIGAPDMLRILRATTSINHGILNCLRADIDRVMDNNETLLQTISTLEKYYNSPDYIGNIEGMKAIITNGKAKLK